MVQCRHTQEGNGHQTGRKWPPNRKETTTKQERNGHQQDQQDSPPDHHSVQSNCTFIKLAVSSIELQPPLVHWMSFNCCEITYKLSHSVLSSISWHSSERLACWITCERYMGTAILGRADSCVLVRKRGLPQQLGNSSYISYSVLSSITRYSVIM